MTKQQINFSRFTLIGIALVCLHIYHVSGTECGTVARTKEVTFSSRIIGGESVSRGDWPFIAALYRVKHSGYFCGGTLISNKHILTAANCIQSKGSSRKLLPQDIEVRLGAFNLTKKNEADSVRINVSQIFVHPEWNVYADEYDANVAILVLTYDITFTNFIRPVCLPADNTSIDGYNINVTGNVVGWGLAENRAHEEIPKHADIRALNDSYCYLHDKGIVSISSVRTFCGGYGDGTPNIGDAGGGFFVKFGSVWVQYGIISASRTDGIGQIVMNSYSVYANVKSFKNWIVDVTKDNFSSFSTAYTFN